MCCFCWIFAVSGDFRIGLGCFLLLPKSEVSKVICPQWPGTCMWKVDVMSQAHHSCFPPSPLVAKPAGNRTFRSRRVTVLVPPSTSFVSPACPSPWQFYYNCNCCKRVDCLVHVTGEFKSKNPVSDPQAPHSQAQMSLNSSQTGQQDPVTVSIMKMEILFLWCRCAFSFGGSLLFVFNKQVLLCLGSGR